MKCAICEKDIKYNKKLDVPVCCTKCVATEIVRVINPEEDLTIEQEDVTGPYAVTEEEFKRVWISDKNGRSIMPMKMKLETMFNAIEKFNFPDTGEQIYKKD